MYAINTDCSNFQKFIFYKVV